MGLCDFEKSRENDTFLSTDREPLVRVGIRQDGGLIMSTSICGSTSVPRSPS